MNYSSIKDDITNLLLGCSQKRHEQKKHPFTVIVEGNIGAGKSSFLKQFKESKIIEICQEPIQKWKNVGGENLLQNMYLNPKKYGHQFQSYVQLCMLENHVKIGHKQVKLMERSIYSSQYIFSNNLYKSSFLTGSEYEV